MYERKKEVVGNGLSPLLDTGQTPSGCLQMKTVFPDNETRILNKKFKEKSTKVKVERIQRHRRLDDNSKSWNVYVVIKAVQQSNKEQCRLPKPQIRSLQICSAYRFVSGFNEITSNEI